MQKVIIVAVLLLLAGCRTADWYMKKAIEKGAAIDTTTRIVMDTIAIKQLRDSISKLVDPSVIYELCQQLLKPDSSLDNTMILYPDTGRLGMRYSGEYIAVPNSISPKTGKIIKKMQKALCPQLDSTYLIPIHVDDSLYTIPVHIKLEDGKYILKTASVDIGYRTAQTDVSIRTTKGFTWKDLIWAGVAGWILGIVIFAILFRR